VGFLSTRGTLAAFAALACMWLGSASAGAVVSGSHTRPQSHASSSHKQHVQRAKPRSCRALKAAAEARRARAAKKARDAEKRRRTAHATAAASRPSTANAKRSCRRPPAKTVITPVSGLPVTSVAPVTSTPTAPVASPPKTCSCSSSPAAEPTGVAGSPKTKITSPTPPGETTSPPPPGETAPGNPTPPSSSDPFANERFYVEPNSAPSKTEQEWASAGRGAEAAEIAKIATQPSAEWFGDWSDGHGGTAGDVNWWVTAATSAGTLPVMVAYDLPWRDCSQFSSGGAANAAAYRQFINAMAEGIAGRKAVVILEPDALPELTCLNAEQQATYYSLLSYAVTHLGESHAVSVYLDAGNAGWQPAATIATRLREANVAGARGFSLNVSNFDSSASETAYGEAVDQQLGNSAHFIIDTSRNGQGSAPGGAWCNPPGRGLGTPSTSQTGNALIDAYFWVKRPGQSDGECNGGPAAGQWWPEYALGLARNAAG
jgi:endoglucanase